MIFFQNALLDLLGTSDSMDFKPADTTPSLTNHTVSTNNQDLLDLLGGLDMNPTTPVLDAGLGLFNNLTNNNNSTLIFNNQNNSNFLVDGILNSQDNHSKLLKCYLFHIFYFKYCIFFLSSKDAKHNSF